MPYFVFEIKTFGRFHKVAEHAVFADASRQAKQLRARADLEPGSTVKVMFAENEVQAVDLLCEPRQRVAEGDD